MFHENLDVLDLETRGKGLPKLVRLLRVRNAKCVKVVRATHLEFRGSWHLLDLHRASILSAGNVKKILDLLNLLRLHSIRKSLAFRHHVQAHGRKSSQMR